MVCVTNNLIDITTSFLKGKQPDSRHLTFFITEQTQSNDYYKKRVLSDPAQLMA